VEDKEHNQKGEGAPPLPYLPDLPRPRARDVDLPLDAGRNTYLHQLCRRDAPLVLINDAVRALGANVDAANLQGMTPLAVAIEHGSPILLRRLVELGAATVTPDFNAILHAVERKRYDMLYTLVRLGAVDGVNRGGRLPGGATTRDTPLLRAAEAKRPDLFPPLLDAGAHVNAARAADGKTALHLAAEDADPRGINILLARGADPRVAAEDALTPLHAAAVKGRPQSVEALLNAGADVNAATTTGYTPLMLAVEHSSVDCLRQLLAAGADTDVQGYEGRTALMLAARRGNTEMVEMLLLAGADPLLEDRKRETAAAQVTRQRHEELYHLLAGAAQASLTGRFEAAHRRMIKQPTAAKPPPRRDGPGR
jgi:ankyrin repeat protein